MLEKTLQSLLDHKEMKPVHPKGNQSWIFIGSTDAEAEAPLLWPPDGKYWLTGKEADPERLKAGGQGSEQGWVDWLASLTRGIGVWASCELVMDREAWPPAVHAVTKSQTGLRDGVNTAQIWKQRGEVTCLRAEKGQQGHVRQLAWDYTGEKWKHRQVSKFV